LVFRNRFGKIEGAVKLTDENSIFKQEGKDEQGSLEFYYDFNNDILNAWLYEKNTKVLRVLNKVVTDINNPQSLSTTKVLDVRCSSIFVQSRHYHCTTNPFLNANGGLNMNVSCGWVSGGFVEFKSCGRGGGPGSATGGGGGGGGSNGNSNWPSAKSPRQEDCSTFENRVGDVLNTEGAYTNDPDDPGGPTNKGISWNVWLSYAKEVVGVEPTLDNLKNITKDQAKQIYKTKYWDAIYADQVLDGDLRFLLFDFFVNSGANAVKVLQRTINDLGGLVSVDGQIGINTINAINSLNSVELYNTYKSNRQIYYNNIVKRKPKQAKYIKGWTNRVNQFVDKKTGNSSNVNCK
jgi:lysozyme family protein